MIMDGIIFGGKNQQFHQYQQNEDLLVTFNHLIYADVYSAGIR
jgi:hypothetical protein